MQDKRFEGSSVQGLVDAALEIARKRKETLTDLRKALEVNDSEGALKLARKLCGLEEQEKGH
jgi:hypothetical protein